MFNLSNYLFDYILWQPIWEAILDFDPDLFVWMGDNIYGDNRRPSRIWGPERTVGPWKNVDRFFPSSEEELKRRYELARNKTGYTELRRRAKVGSRFSKPVVVSVNHSMLATVCTLYSMN